jgi:hypothetical protein
MQMARAQDAPAIDADAAGDQVDARCASLALGAHLRGKEEAKPVHRVG